jgi:hypothetical protein
MTINAAKRSNRGLRALRGETASTPLALMLGLAGAVVGGLLGYLLFRWIPRQGFYGPFLPGALAGIGCGLLSRQRSWLLAVVCAVIGLGVGLFAEWQRAPFIADNSFMYFLTHLHRVDAPVTIAMIVLGGAFGFWFGLGRKKK